MIQQHVRKWCTDILDDDCTSQSTLTNVNIMQIGRTNILKPTGHLGHHKYHNSEEVVMAAGEWLRMLQPNCYLHRTFKIWPRWGKCINVLGDCGGNYGTSAK
jgi:hypothetical protein